MSPVLMYLFYANFIPAIFVIISYSAQFEKYNGLEGGWTFFIYFLVMMYYFVTLLIISSIKIKIRPVLVLNDRILNLIVFLFSFLSFIVSIHYYFNFDMTFRHSQRLSNSGVSALLPYLKAVSNAYILYVILLVLPESKKSKICNTNLFLFLISFLLSFNSSFDIIYIIILFVILVGNSNNIKHLYILRLSFKNISVFALVGIFVLLAGLANKGLLSYYDYSYDRVHILIDDLFTRFSVSIVSSLNFIDLKLSGHNFDTFNVVISRIYQRLESIGLIEGSSSGFSIGGINRANYLLLYKDADITKFTGASPGLVGSSLYSNYWSISFLIFTIYIAFIQVIFNTLKRELKFKMSPLFVFLISLLLLPLLESPFDILSLFSPSFVFLFFLLLFVLFTGRHKDV